jgi:hypothetical protein
MPAASTDKFIKGARRWSGQIGGGGVADGVVDVIPLVSAIGLPTDTAVEITIDRVDANGAATPSKEEVIRGVVSGSNIINAVRGVEGTPQAHAAGAVVEVKLTSDQWNRMVDGIAAEHGQDGSHKSSIFNKIPLYAPQGFLINGKIVPSVTSNNLTVAIKTLAGTDPSVSDPVYVRIGDTVRTITSAISVTKNAGTNWFNAGSSELATKEIDYFVYLGYNATDGVVIGFSRYPGANQYGDFSATTTNEKYCAISTITNAASTDYYEVIGRFAATLSAGAGYTWSVPTFTANNLIQRPIYETRELSIYPQPSGWTLGNGTSDGRYKIIGNKLWYTGKFIFGSSTSIGSSINQHGSGRFLDAGVAHYGIVAEMNSVETIEFFNGSSSTQQIAGNYPVTMAINDTVIWQIEYCI